MKKSKIYLMGVATLIGFPILGITLIGIFESDPWAFDINWFTPMNVWLQIAIGLIFGTAAGFLAWWMINRPEMRKIKMKYGILIHRFKLSFAEILFLSFSAGVGEEFLFRGILQPYWGVWITAIFFVAIHGYLDPRDKKMMSYGLLMTVVIGILGYLKIYSGLIAPMAAHFAIDVVLLYKLTTDKAFVFKPEQPSFMFQEKVSEPTEHEEESTENHIESEPEKDTE